MRLDDGLQMIFQDFGEKILQLRASEKGQNVTPVRRILKFKNYYLKKELSESNKTHSSAEINTLNLPKLGFNLPAKIFRAVDLPIPLVPTRPSTWPGLGVGSLWSLNELGPNRCVVSLPKLLGRLIIEMASNGHF